MCDRTLFSINFEMKMIVNLSLKSQNRTEETAKVLSFRVLKFCQNVWQNIFLS